MLLSVLFGCRHRSEHAMSGDLSGHRPGNLQTSDSHHGGTPGFIAFQTLSRKIGRITLTVASGDP